MIIQSTLKIYLTFLFILLISVNCGDDDLVKEIIRPVRAEQVFSTGEERIRTFSGIVQSGKESKLSR